MVTDVVSATGEVVGPTGTADGLGEGLMEEVGLLNGESPTVRHLVQHLASSLEFRLAVRLVHHLGKGTHLAQEKASRLGYPMEFPMGY